jgi:hypothetical protein
MLNSGEIMDMNPVSARAILYSRGMSPRQVSEGFRGLSCLPEGSAARFVSCAEEAEDTANRREVFFGEIVQDNGGALPLNARDLVQSIAGLRIEAQAWRALAREAS